MTSEMAHIFLNGVLLKQPEHKFTAKAIAISVDMTTTEYAEDISFSFSFCFDRLGLSSDQKDSRSKQRKKNGLKAIVSTDAKISLTHSNSSSSSLAFFSLRQFFLANSLNVPIVGLVKMLPPFTQLNVQSGCVIIFRFRSNTRKKKYGQEKKSPHA